MSFYHLYSFHCENFMFDVVTKIPSFVVYSLNVVHPHLAMIVVKWDL